MLRPLIQPRGESQSSASKGRRCQECDGCKADPCGQCNACQKTPDLCKERECTNRLVRGQKNLHGVAPIVQNHQESSIKKGHNPRRYKRCNECDGCKVRKMTLARVLFELRHSPDGALWLLPEL